jgi:hypothetical protein
MWETVGSPDTDMVQPAVVAEGDHAGGVDPVAADPVVTVGVPVAGRERSGQRVIGEPPRGCEGS